MANKRNNSYLCYFLIFLVLDGWQIYAEMPELLAIMKIALCFFHY